MRFSSRVLLCLIGVLRNASIWGDASIDSVSAHTYGFSNNRISDSRNCARPCKFGQSPRRCIFDFRIAQTRLNDRTVLSINEQVPGPPIQVCLNDIVVVNVFNALQGGEVGIHWRGMTQKGSPFMDGVPMVTQCPIVGGATFSYAFRADEPGTHFYHAHSVSQHLEGLYGMLLVKQPYPLEPGFPLYDYDRIPEDVFMVTAGTSGYGSSKADRLLINGREERKRTYVTADGRYRMRTINAIPLDCPIVITIQNHQMIIISSDGRAVKPAIADSFVLYPGERGDFILNSNQPPSLYEFQVKGLLHCKNLYQKAYIIYENLNVTISDVHEEINEMFYFDTLSSQNLLSTSGPPAALTVSPVSEKSVYLQVDVNSYQVDDDDNEYRYLSDAMPVPSFYPSELTAGGKITEVTQINHKSFIYPNSPILTQPNDVSDRVLCFVGYESKSKYFECTSILEVDFKSTLELIVVDEGFGSDAPKTFHLHGNPMYVLSTSESYEHPITRDFVKKLDDDGKIKRNLLNPPKKDTIGIPNKGFVIVRIIADNIGAWLLECPACGVKSLPAAIVIKVNAKLPEKVLKVLPKCGNFKRPDTLLN